MTLCLGLEAATMSPGVGLADENGIRWQMAEAHPASKAQAVFVYLAKAREEGLLNLDRVDLIAVTAGPGSFTGLKVGLTAAKTLGWSLDIPVVGVSSLKALAASTVNGDRSVAGLIAPVLDARRSMIYTALFRMTDGRLERLAEDRAVDPEEWSRELAELAGDEPLLLTGDGLKAYASLMTGILPRAGVAAEEDRFIRPGWVAHLGLDAAAEGRAVTAFELNANYLRPPDAKLPAKPLVSI